MGALADVPLVHLDTQPRAGRSLDEAVVENQRVERGLYVCKECDTVANADVNGAENIRQKVLSSLATDGGDRDSGWLAQPAVHLFDRSEGRFAPREQVANREP
ncbi:transposase, IS605 OrfB family protein [Haloferax volcanii JCM 10717]|uniref:Transposase n=3 Tax=Haloferax volcanii TaxID=2246 RepID=A0A558G146_HALVO|nr:transposase, IS605 OrfB family protein [Haloferax lucentense DSM 14919]ELZ87947.1 transposase, IS605 OrfB family protein [Haloferax alexandrinus JCM 10717]NLV03665.1 transposase [Haloferax alexandrinus]TVT91487.1 transposase [Haloferax volcanii]